MTLIPGNDPLTLEQKQQLTLQRLNDMTARVWSMMRDVQNDGIDYVWSNPYGLTPQEVYDALATNGQKANDFHYALTVVLATQAAVAGVSVALKYPTKAMTSDVSGVVTVTEDPWVAPE